MPKGSRREVDAPKAMLRMDAEQAPIATVRVELLARQPSPLVQRRVERQRRMSLGEDKAVAVGGIGIADVHAAGVEGGDDVGDRQGRADVADPGTLGLLQDGEA